MRNINEYKRRFDKLLESTMGNVKPLISESTEFEEFVVPTLDMLKDAIVRTVKDGKITGDLISYDDNFKKTFTGNEYKITLPEGMYEAGEEIDVAFFMDPIFIIQNVILYKSANVVTDYQNNTAYADKTWNLDNLITFQFKIPNTQKELEENSPFTTYVDFPCKNVRGGKIRFSVEVPSGSEIFEKPEDVNERDLTRIVRRVINEQSNDPQAVVIECIMKNTTLKDLETIPTDCVKLLSGDMTKMFACMSNMDSNTFNTIKSKIVPITKCVTTKMGGGSSFPEIEF